ncbi:hypothetical protein [Gemmobacter sp. 24YEA27]|uniref:hypothetical protein n=1 Tax=Gemmobacter sp. 24YEA27 TaxID=3040672 RepID=UPI0024B3A082|nr:hypothetical protein [Gemmobacter sp. 24YEA27]
MPLVDLLITSPPEDQKPANAYPMAQYTRAALEVAVAIGAAHLDHQYFWGAAPSYYASGNSARPCMRSDGIHPAPLFGGFALADAVTHLLSPGL